MMDMASFVFLGAFVSVLSCLLIPQLLTLAGFLDVPSDRSSHSRPTPKGGGVGFVLAFAWAGVSCGFPLYFLFPPIALAVLSFVNDLRGISPLLRLAVQLMAAALVLVASWGDWGGSGALFLLLPAVIFVAGTANCYNFMDGINGIAGITGVVAFTALSLFGIEQDAALPFLPPVLAVIGALLAFLPFNLPMARLFMGDVGSVFLGFLFSISVCLLAESWTDFLVMASFLYPFYADEAVTMAERLWCKESLLQPHRRHMYQFLVNERKIAHWKVSVAYGLIQICMGVAVVMAAQKGALAVLTLDVAVLFVWTLAHFLLKYSFLRKSA